VHASSSTTVCSEAEIEEVSFLLGQGQRTQGGYCPVYNLLASKQALRLHGYAVTGTRRLFRQFRKKVYRVGDGGSVETTRDRKGKTKKVQNEVSRYLGIIR
jgi:hypothetical protein